MGLVLESFSGGVGGNSRRCGVRIVTLKVGKGDSGSSGEVGGVEDAERGRVEEGVEISEVDVLLDVAGVVKNVVDVRVVEEKEAETTRSGVGVDDVVGEDRVELGDIIRLSLRARGPAGRLRGGDKLDIEDTENRFGTVEMMDLSTLVARRSVTIVLTVVACPVAARLGALVP